MHLTRTATRRSTPGKRGIHPYALWSVLFVGIALLFPFLVPGFGMFFMPVCWVMAAMLGVQTLVRYRWPGRTATERARRPTLRDVLIATVGILLGLALFAVYFLHDSIFG